MTLAVLGWGLLGGGCIVVLYGLLLHTYKKRFWDSQGFTVAYLMLMLSSLALLSASHADVVVFTSPYAPSLIMMAWFFATVTYVPVRLTRLFVKHGRFHVLTPATIFLIAVFLSYLLALLFSVAFLSGSLVFAT